MLCLCVHCLHTPYSERKRRKRNWEEHDYYDSDEDTFLDRTGTSEVPVIIERCCMMC